ncbi:MAG: PEGA domain-containing protein [Planctomycetes bacterium]|nr:PEGA domain-containing protein [Planctomycetota bacterium]
MRMVSTVILLALVAVGCSTSTTIRTDPPGAAVFVDGKEVGQSPLNYSFSTAAWNQSYEVKCVLEGYYEAMETVRRVSKGLMGMGGADWPESIFIQLKQKPKNP